MAKETISVTLKNKSGILQCSNINTFRVIREKFSVSTPNYKKKKFDIRTYVITPSGAFEPGLWQEIEKFILSLKIPFKITVSDEFKSVYSPKLSSIPLQLIDGFTYYDYQEFMIKEMLKDGRGICLAATSSGKSIVCAGLCKSIHIAQPNARILIIVPNISLLNQLYDSFLTEFSLPIIERWGDGNVPTFESPVLIANMQILSSDIVYTISQLKDYDYVIVDEVHRLGEKEKFAKNKEGKSVLKHQLSKIVHNIDTPHKWGLTGTLPDNYLAWWNIIGKIGPILYEKTSYEIRKQGTATDVKIHVIYCEHSEEIPDPYMDVEDKNGDIVSILDERPTARYNAERIFLYRCEQRNDIIKKLVKNLKGNVLILVDNIEQGEILQILLESLERKLYFVRGSMETSVRSEITKEMEVENDVVAIAMSQIFSTGISVKNLPNVIFCGIGKSVVKIMQSIGRSMRLHENKDLARIFDISDDTKYAKEHVKKRLSLYKDEKLEYEFKRIKL